MKIAEGIHKVDGVNCNVYLVEDGKELVLIDTGLPRSANKIVKYLQSLGRKPSDISTIVLTHFHIDHVGSVKNLKKLSNAKVAVGEFDADIVTGKKAAPKPKNLMFRALSSVIKAAPVETELLLKDNEKVGRLTVIYTPGHSDGSISLLDAERKVMFVGDAIRFIDGKLTGPPERFSLDMVKAKDSIKKISMFDFEIMLSGHGQPLMDDASQKVKDFYTTMK